MKNLDGCTDLVEEFVQLNPEYRSMVPGFIPKPVPAKRKRRQDSEQSQVLILKIVALSTVVNFLVWNM